MKRFFPTPVHCQRLHSSTAIDDTTAISSSSLLCVETNTAGDNIAAHFPPFLHKR